jgi:carboxylesterase type B
MDDICSATVTATTERACFTGTATAAGLVFRGIQYARPIAGRLRWSAPEPVDPSGTVDATRPGHACRQGVMDIGPTSALWRSCQPEGDDCLNLNVYTPTLMPAEPLPVLVWLHGGQLVVGDAANPAYDGRWLARQGVVVVTVNYRLGYPGWLDLRSCFPELTDADNRGLRDQLTALDWVARNVHAFGGDADLITVAGQSAGACAALAVAASPARSVKIRRVAALSPTSTAFIPVADQAPVAHAFCRELRVPPGNLDGLLAVPASQALDAQNRVEATLRRSFNVRRYGAAARRSWGAGIALGTRTLPEHPITALGRGCAPGVDLLIGTTSQEWRTYSAAGIPNNALATRLLLYAFTGKMTGHRAAIRRARSRTTSRSERHDEVFTELLFGSVAREVADAQSRHGRSYLYCNDAVATGPLSDLGAGHGVDVALWWNNIDAPLGRAIGADKVPLRAAGERLGNMFAAFVRTGTPGDASWHGWCGSRSR